ncbi:membrane protein [Lacticaseibacillus rhamnosus MTCC 5462]|nr:membrane protein [Lacticaseibacillus rhamnosus MTCC 5462]
MAGIWSLTNITVITVNGAAYLLETIWLYLLIRAVYLGWPVLLGLIAATIVLATKASSWPFSLALAFAGYRFSS